MRHFTNPLARLTRPTPMTALQIAVLFGVGLTFGVWLSQFVLWRPGLVSVLTSAAVTAVLSRPTPALARAAALGVTAGVAAGIAGIFAGVWPPAP